MRLSKVYEIMLDRTKIIKELSLRYVAASEIVSNEYALAQELWHQSAYNIDLESVVSGSRLPCPSWQGLLGAVVGIEKPSWYEVLAVDGSQIYPDRHQATSCYLLNMGIVHLQYLVYESRVRFDSNPIVVFEGEKGSGEYTPEIVNAQRGEKELSTGLLWMQNIVDKAKNPCLFMVDGSLIFWHLVTLQATNPSLDFLKGMFSLMDQFCKNKYPLVGYISCPKSRDLVNILRAVASHQSQAVDFATLSDSAIAHFYLKPGMRSMLFQSKSPICSSYPKGSEPYFYYLNTGQEIARVELPAFVALDSALLESVTSIVYDQACKGQGYPIALAEAHEQAVVTNGDKEFFYHMLQSLQPLQNQIGPSVKSMRKRRMNV